MKLDKLLNDIQPLKIKNSNPNSDIKDISCNSKLVRTGCLFVAIKGTCVDGHRFIAEAIKRGARAVVVEDVKRFDSIKADIATICVDDTRKALARLAANFYNHPSRKIKVIGITGTNGKTTVSYLLERVLKEAGFKVGVLGTINYRLNGKIYNSINTTPGALTIQSYLKKMVTKKIDYAIIEVSSHALDQERVAAVEFSCAIFTNLTQDHLDYHKSRERYFRAKSKLFAMLSSNSSAIVNNDDPCARKITKLTRANIFRFGLKNSNIRAKNIKLQKNYTEFCITTQQRDILIKSPLIGMHNVYNILATIACTLSCGLDIKKIKNGILKLESIPGRLESVCAGQPCKVFIDYAHTEDGLKRVLGFLRTVYSKNKIICVFGCGGNRDKSKRPKMGRVASSLSDYVIVTSDNPREEKPTHIAGQITSGINGKNFEIIIDRKEAIKRSFILADRNSVILIAGKGHEQCQIIKGKRIPFNDREVAEQVIKSLW